MNHMFDVAPFTESTIEDVLDYIERELLGDIDPHTLFISKMSQEISKETHKQLVDFDTQATIYRISSRKFEFEDVSFKRILGIVWDKR